MVDGQRQSYYGLTKADALAGPSRIDNRERRQAAVTLADFLTDWLSASRQTVKPATWRKYDSVIRLHVLPTLGGCPLADVRASHLTALYAALAKKGLGATSIHHAHVVIGTGLQAAVDQGRLEQNPARTVKAPRVAEVEPTILSPQEAAQLLRAARGDRLEALYVLALTTGIRQGELLALHWSDIGPNNDRLTVSGTVARGLNGKHEIASPKTRAARRMIQLPRVAVDALARARIAATPTTRQLIRTERPVTVPREALVFPAERGGILTGTNLLHRHFHPLLTRAGLPQMKFHDLRHTAITHMLSRGTPHHVVAQIVGHASVAVTLGQYGHVTQGMQDAAVAAMDALYPVG
jgi:integrase